MKNAVEAASAIEDLKLRNVTTGETSMGPEDPYVIGNRAYVRFLDTMLIQKDNTVLFDIMGDVTHAAIEECEIKLVLLMYKVRVRGMRSGLISKGGQNGYGPHDIKPTGNPSTKYHTIVGGGSLTVIPVPLAGDTYVSRADSKLVWKGTLQANGSENLVVRSISFNQIAAALDDDIDSCDLFIQEGTVSTLKDQGEDIDFGVLRFSQLDADGETGITYPSWR